VPNYIKIKRNNIFNSNQKSNDVYPGNKSANIYNIEKSNEQLLHLKKRNYIEKDNKYFVENKLYKDNAYNIISKKIYRTKSDVESCRNYETDLHLTTDKSNKIIFSIFNNAYYPKNNYDFEIFDFKTENKNNIQKYELKENFKNNAEEKNANVKILKELKELNIRLKDRLDKIEEDQKNKQKDINYLLKKMKNLNNHENKENNKVNNEEILKVKKKSKRAKVKPLGLYHRLAGGYNVQNFNVNRNMIIKNKDD
jgi:hypothetical protein